MIKTGTDHSRHATPMRVLRRIARWVAWSVATLLICVVLAFLYVTFVGITMDASFLRERIAQTFTDNIGRTVRFDGPMEMVLSARPRLLVGGLHISNPIEFGGGDFASLGEARLAVDLWPLLFQKQLRIDELAGSNVRIRLQSRADGSNNWTLHLPEQKPQTSAPSRSAPVRPDEAVALLDIQLVSLQSLNVEYVSNEGQTHFFDLYSLEAQSPANEPLKLFLRGAVEKEFPYSLDLSGGKLSELANENPWPVAFTLTFLSSTLSVSGTVTSRGTGDFAFGLGTENLAEFERLLQTDFPDVGATGLSANVKFSPRHVALEQLTGVMGDTSITGDLKFDTTGAKPRLTGSLIARTLDMRPFLGEKSGSGTTNSKKHKATDDGEEAPPRNLSELYRNIAEASFDLRRLNNVDADITLGVQRWLSLPGDIEDVQLQIRLQDGVLQAPLTGSAAGVTLAGRADADAVANPPTFNLALTTSNSDLGGLAELLFGVPGIRGQLGRFDLKLAATGNQGSELVQSLDIELNVERGRFSYGNIEGERPVNFALDRMTLRLPPGERLGVTMGGSLLEQPFTATLTGGILENIMLEGRGPLDFRLRSGDVRARIHGTIERPSENRGPELTFDFSAPRAGDLASWFGLTPGAQAPAKLHGKVRLRESSWRVGDIALNLGRSSFSAELSQRLVEGKPLMLLRLDSKQIDVAQLESMLPKTTKPKPADDSAVLDIPLLPQEIDLNDADIAVKVARVVGTPVDVGAVSFDGRIREGYMYPSPFSASVADTTFNGAVLLDLRGAEPIAGLWLHANKLNVGNVLRKLSLARDLEADFSDFAVNLTARSSRLGNMLSRSQLLGSVGGGRIVLRDRNTDGEARITVEMGELRADPGEPVRLAIEGALDQVPVSISIDTAPAHELANPKLPLHFTLNADAANARVTLRGNIARPIGTELEFSLDARGERFADLDDLAGASLPPWGPWSALGGFRISPRGYEVSDLRLQVGKSTLTGLGRLDTETGRPRIIVELDAPIIQLDDFKLGDWSPMERRAEDKTEKLTPEQMSSMASEASQKAQKLLSPGMLRRQDVFLTVRVEQVLSGADKLGAGRMQAKLENGRADIGPIEVEIPGGTAKIRLGYEPTEQNVNVDLHIDVEKFDYGVLARRIKPGTDLAGSFTLKVDVGSRARYLSEVLHHGNGRIDFAIWPLNMQAGVIDLWAVNVLVALAKEVDPEKASKINCAVGRFELNDGMLVDNGIILDTSRIRVVGTGGADFRQEQFALRMRPQSKTAQFLSLATPLGVSGSFYDFEITLSPGDVLETFARFMTSIIWVPLQKLAGNKLPADGADVCTDPLQTLSAQ